MSARVLVALLILVAGCSSYVAPTSVRVDPAALDEARLIPYRTLVRADFKARCAPEELDAASVGAVTAALVRTSCCRITTFRRERDSAFVAVVEDLWFEARMSQNHSWWNPERANEPLLLEHEQTHFAFSELAARSANARIGEISARIQAVAKTEREAICLARARLQREVDGVQAEIAARDADFDRETLNGRRTDSSHRWFIAVQRELRASDMIATGAAPRAVAAPFHSAVLTRFVPSQPE